jgi:hypothetical protein
MSQPELVKRVAAALKAAGINYMLTGSVVSSLQGEPRSTHDVDFVVEMNVQQSLALVKEFPAPEFYVSEDAVKEALRTQRMFNILAIKEGDKADVWILKDDAFDRSRFSRRIEVDFFGEKIILTTPEDTILYKLSWARQSGGSEKQFNDAKGVYEVQHHKLDESYLSHWSRILKVEDSLDQIRREAEPIA